MAQGININDFKTFTEFLAKKSGKGNYASPSQFNQLVNRALIEFIYLRNGNKQEYQAGRPVPRISYEKTSDVMDDLRYIKEVREFVVVDSKIGIPDGSTVKDINGAICPEYIHLKSLRHYYFVQTSTSIVKKQYDLDVIVESELGMRLVSAVEPPSKRYPIAQINSGDITVYPSDIQYVVMDYTRYPATATWNYTETNGRPVYNSIGSIDIELPKECMNELAMMYLSFLGINMRDAELVQYSEMNKQKGV